MAEPVYRSVVLLAVGLFRALGVRFDVTGTEHLPRTGGAVLAMNHVGYLDFAFAGYAARPAGRLVRFMAKKEVFDRQPSGALMRGMHHIPVDRGGAAGDSYRTALAALADGEIVGVFPEATISRSFELKDFKSGAVRLAMRGGVPLVPCVLWGSQRIMTKGRPRDLTRGTHVRIVIGEAFLPEPGADPVAVSADLKARMQALLVQARATYGGAPRGPADTWWMPVSLGGTAPTLEEASSLDRTEQIARRAARRAATKGS